jgi:ABC-type bacteriocin/lantibiotic exporter with double-glycine peptidase domain
VKENSVIIVLLIMFKEKDKKKEKNTILKLGIKKVVSEVKKRKKEFVIIFILSLFMSLGDGLTKLFLGKVIDTVVSTNNVEILNFSFSEKFFYPTLFFITVFVDLMLSSIL